MRILEVKFLAIIVALLTTIAGYLATEKHQRDAEKLAQEKHRQEIVRAIRAQPPLRVDGISTAEYKQ